VLRLVYFISEVLSKSKVCYPTIQKLLYGVLITSRKLCHYFDAYNILVVTDFSFGGYHPELGRCRSHLQVGSGTGALTLDFKPRTAIKSQAQFNFMAEW
jgi:hypothetical protein